MKVIGFEREEEAIAWAKERLGIARPTGFCRAISAVDSRGEFVLVVVLSNFSKTNIDMHTAAVAGGTWATPKGSIRMFNFIFEYAFKQLGALRVTGLVRASNWAARKFDEHLGFTLEGIMRKAFDGDDLCIYGFLDEDYALHSWARGT
jgi:RimJ/RimL family protein N-acetyltransferase